LLGDVHAEHERLEQALSFLADQAIDASLAVGDKADGTERCPPGRWRPMGRGVAPLVPFPLSAHAARHQMPEVMAVREALRSNLVLSPSTARLGALAVVSGGRRGRGRNEGVDCRLQRYLRELRHTNPSATLERADAAQQVQRGIEPGERLNIRGWLSGVPILVLLAMAAFTKDSAAANCVPGAQVQCACPAGGSGVQTCSDDGARLGSCDCAAGPSAVPAASPSTVNVSVAPGATKMQSGALWGTGLVFVIAGAAGVATGAALIAAGAVKKGCEGDGGSGGAPFCMAGGVAAGVSVALLGAGLPMLIIGGKEVPDDQSTARNLWIPSVTLGLQLQLDWAF
jgi:hypothetical protein